MYGLMIFETVYRNKLKIAEIRSKCEKCKGTGSVTYGVYSGHNGSCAYNMYSLPCYACGYLEWVL